MTHADVFTRMHRKDSAYYEAVSDEKKTLENKGNQII